MTEMTSLRLEFFVHDVETSERFYTEIIGFSVDDAQSSGTYRALMRDDVRISLQARESLSREHPLHYDNERPGLGIEIVIEVDDVDDCYQIIASLIPVESTLELRPWGLRDFRVLDPDGIYLRITERQGERASRPSQ